MSDRTNVPTHNFPDAVPGPRIVGHARPEQFDGAILSSAPAALPSYETPGVDYLYEFNPEDRP